MPPELRVSLGCPGLDLATSWALWLDQLELRRHAGLEQLDILRCGETAIGYAGLMIPSRPGFARRAEIHYFVAEPWRRKGLGSLGVRALVDRTFESLAIDEIRAAVVPGNEPSLRLLARLGFEELSADDPEAITEAKKARPHRLFSLLRDA